MPCGAADTCKSFGVLHIEEKERRTQSEVFTATDRTGSGEGGCHRERRAASAHAQSLGSAVQLLGDMAAACLLLTYFACLSLHGARGAPGYFRRLCLNHSQTWRGWLSYHIPLKIQN